MASQLTGGQARNQQRADAQQVCSAEKVGEICGIAHVGCASGTILGTAREARSSTIVVGVGADVANALLRPQNGIPEIA